MNVALVGALTLLLATNPPAALTNMVLEKTGLSLLASKTNDPVATELQSIMDEDDRAQDDIDRWIEEADEPKTGESLLKSITLRGRITQRIEPIKDRYRRFLDAHPTNAAAFLAFGSFLNAYGEEREAIEQWEKARQLDPKNPAPWNNLANSYAHIGPVTNSFFMYEEALRLRPNEPVYLHNFGTLVFLFRRDATNYFQCDEQAIFEKAFSLYQKAIQLDPQNFQLAADVAQTYYGWKLPKATNAVAALQAEQNLAATAMKAWTNALSLAPTDAEREGIQLHLARWNIRLGRWAEASNNLAAVTNEVHEPILNRLRKSLQNHQKENANKTGKD